MCFGQKFKSWILLDQHVKFLVLVVGNVKDDFNVIHAILLHVVQLYEKGKNMGTFAGLYREPEAGIPDEKIEEFKARVEMLFQAGGMMEVESVSLFGKDIVTIRKAFMDEDGMDFIYNYFEDDFWENAGCDGDNGYVWSNKIGWRQFHTAMVAAYVLQELYMDGTAIAMVDSEFVTTLAYTGWINYLFDENFCFKNRDPWKLFEVMNEQEGDDHAIKRIDWSEFISDECGMLGYYEIYAVIYGTDAAIARILPYYEKAGGTDDNMNFYNCSKWIKEAILDFKEESTLSEEEQVFLLTEMFREYYEQDSLLGSMGIKYEEDVLKKIRVLAVVSDVPAFIFKAIAEIYGKDFWELWRGGQDVARRTVIGVQGMNHVVKKVTTQELFQQKDDDMIPYWSSDSDIHFPNFSRKLWNIYQTDGIWHYGKCMTVCCTDRIWRKPEALYLFRKAKSMSAWDCIIWEKSLAAV